MGEVKTMDKIPKVYHQVSKTQLSVARHAGRTKINGHEYIYIIKDDVLVLKSHLKTYKKSKKQ